MGEPGSPEVFAEGPAGPDGLSAATSAGEGGGGTLLCGYLSQRQSGPGYLGWVRRFYTLTPHVLYYGDSEGGDPVGAVLIKPDLQLSTRAEADGSSCLVLSSPNIQSVSLAGVDPEDTRVWRTHLSEALRLAHATVHSMLTVRYGSGTWHEWFCVLRKNGIDCHQSPLHTPSGSIPVTAQCDIDWDDTELTFYLVRSVGQGVKKGIFVKSGDRPTYLRWKQFLSRRLREIKGSVSPRPDTAVEDPTAAEADKPVAEQPAVEQPSDAKPSDAQSVASTGSSSSGGLDSSLTRPTRQVIEPPSAGEILREGELETRPVEGGDTWPSHHFVLTPTSLLQYASPTADRSTPMDAYGFSVNCTVFETNLKASSFQLVASGKVLHAQGTSKDDTTGWINAIRQCISSCRLDPTDALCVAALEREDDVYEVEFKEKRPLGIVLERAGDWALVKMTQAKDSQIEAGSALCRVNGESVVLKDYAAITAMLSGWQPPLTLGFRRSPSMSGWLAKHSPSKKAKQGSWKNRFFRLSGGHLQYFDSPAEDAEAKGDVKLMGCSLTQLPVSELQQDCCFRLTSGLTVLTMRAKDEDEMMQWAAPLYEAVAIANGGGYLLVKERKRLEQEPLFSTEGLKSATAQLDAEGQAADATGGAKLEPIAVEAPADGGAASVSAEAANLQSTVEATAQEAALAAEEAPASEEAVVPEEVIAPEEVAVQEEAIAPAEVTVQEEATVLEEAKPEAMEDTEVLSLPAEEPANVHLAAEVVEPATLPPPPKAEPPLPPAPPQGGGAAAVKEDEMEDSVSPSVSAAPAKKRGDKPPPNSLMAVMDSGRSVGPLTDEQIEKVFNSLNLSGGARTMKPVNFSMFVRLVTGRQNLFFEMDTFHKHFDINNDGFVDLTEFKAGVHRLEAKDPQHCVIVGLRAFVAETLMSL